ncbi:hypothetical protein [Nocardia sp. NPDC049149]|uniref:hypothetical protein n=1 Tax=Nocardia sp. NPDC049149 TaxID=3364315 RepID=UPI003720C1FF
MSYGLLVLYQRHTGDHQLCEFDGPDGAREAVAERLRLERDPRYAVDNVEICALSSESLASIKVTHSRYFGGRQVDFAERSSEGGTR